MVNSNKIFNKFPYLELRLFIAIIISIAIIIVDSNYHTFARLKNYIEDSISLFYYLFDKPKYMLNYISNIFREKNKLISENKILRQEIFLKNSELLLMDQYRKENHKLHKLLNSPISINNKKIITKILYISTNLYNHQIIIDKGSNHSVYIGQPVITDEGIVGQVISTNTSNSHVLLICDPEHALSVRIKRNNIIMILMGHRHNRHNFDLYSECPGNIDIRIGDLLVTSGLDGRFPEGYPVAIVSNIETNTEQDITIVKAYPTAKLEWLSDVILIWQ